MTSKQIILYIRREKNKDEHRTPIVPQDITILLQNGFIVFVQSSDHRIYSDFEYLSKGAIITSAEWYDLMFQSAYIIGLKVVDNLEKLANHKHVYFSHSYKNQTGSRELLNAFSKTQSLIYDFEFFLNKENKRLISFGFYAGIAGCYLGLLQYLQKSIYQNNIANLSQMNFERTCIENHLYKSIHMFANLKIAIVGFRGNCGTGVISVLDNLGVNYSTLGRTFEKKTLKQYDIVYNCINLDSDSKEVWVSHETQFENPIIITDISCDATKDNNPIAIYKDETTWENPVYSYNEFVDIIAVSNLPSLLPKESSTYFSKKCAGLLLDMGSEAWENNEKLFNDAYVRMV